MTPVRDLAGRGLAAAGGVLLAAMFILVIGTAYSEEHSDRERGALPPTDVAPSAGEEETPIEPHSDDAKLSEDDPSRPARGDAFLAWAPGSLPAGTEAAVETMDEVRSATTVYAGLDWIDAWKLPRSEARERPPAGYSIPFEIAAVQPGEYAAFADVRDRRAVARLRPGQALLAATARSLRGAGRGLRIDLGERSVRVVGTVSDETTNGYEAILAGPPPPEWTRSDRFVLARLERPRGHRAVERKIESLLPPGRPLQTRIEGENPFLRYGDAVLPQLLIKATFGEFAARPQPDGTLVVEGSWRRNNIRSEPVPILGRVTCHKILFPQLRAALRDVQRQGLAHAIDPGQFAGCFYPRFINLDPGGRLSHHSWGAAFDLNSQENTFGTKADLDMRIVEIFEDRWGFTWGGRWIVPDGMHFEWVKFP
ncbi:MAG: M15 family metallopeptidase [Actinomycetota bacterium]|nr:M15 family metallopeptidase [Actinomycetota bacterium]